MVPRYEMKEISTLWSDDQKFKTYLEAELAILKAQEQTKIPKGTARKIEEKAKINPARIEEIEKVVHHDIIAFCSSITEQLDSSVGKYFHFGVTSSDIIDTSINLTIKRSLKPILGKLREVLETLKEMAHRHKEVMTIGRSHGMYAEPLSLGGKWLGFYAEFERRYQELHQYYETECTCQFSGAVGNYTIVTPEEEEKAASLLEMPVEKISTQVIPRDRIAKLVSINALLASGIERLATEIRHLHRSEVSELHEGFSKGQKGSSIMPHKKNPIAGENLTGIARVIRSHMDIALENIVLWHERDISHSSAERLFLPDHLGLVLYSLNRLNQTLQHLEVNTEKMEERVLENFNYLSSYFLHQILQKEEVTRELAYEVIQKSVFEAKNRDDFFNNLKKELEEKGISNHFVKNPNPKELKNIYLNSSSKIFARFKF